MGEARGVAYREQVNALGAQGVAVVETLKVIGDKGVRITRTCWLRGGGSGDGGGIGTLLLLNLFREQMKLPTETAKVKPNQPRMRATKRRYFIPSDSCLICVIRVHPRPALAQFQLIQDRVAHPLARIALIPTIEIRKVRLPVAQPGKTRPARPRDLDGTRIRVRGVLCAILPA
jgi:hypothetical protein